MGIASNLRKFLTLAKTQGLAKAVGQSVDYTVRQAPAVLNLKQDPIGHFEFLLGEEQGFGLKITPDNVPKGSMSWVIPDFNASSGGHINILRIMRLMKDRGFHDQRVVVMEPHRWSSEAEAQEALNRDFGDYGIKVSLGVRSIEPCQFLVATGWQTAHWVAKYRDAAHRLYFVQDFEPAFYAHGSEYAFAELTYRLGLVGVTAGSWLAEKLSTEYGMRTFPISFGCDTEFYRPMEKRPSETKHIFFYARSVTPRRCFELGLVALKKVCEEIPNAAVIFAGWDVSGYDIQFHHLNAGTLPLDELPELYSQCDVALVLSSTNLSLLPVEIAACGCPLVLNNGPHSSWLFTDNEVEYCDMSPDAISSAVINLLTDQEKARGLADRALEKARMQKWESEADKFAEFLQTLENEQQAVAAKSPEDTELSPAPSA